MNPAFSASLLMNDTDVRFHLLHIYILKRVYNQCTMFMYSLLGSFHFLRNTLKYTWSPGTTGDDVSVSSLGSFLFFL